MLIQPAFLPGLDERGRYELHRPILKLAATSLKRCHAVEEVIIILNIHRITTPFSKFLRSLWGSTPFTRNLKRLSIRTSSPKMPHFLAPIISNKKRINLEGVTFDVENVFSVVEPSTLKRGTRSFFSAFKDTLTSIDITSNYLSIDFATPLASPPLTFPKLTRVRLCGIFGEETELEIWSMFFARHADTLEHLSMDFHQWNSHHFVYDRPYIAWINPREDRPGHHPLAKLLFPKLHFLQIALLGAEGAMERTQPDACHSRILSNPLSFAPCLTSLVLTGTHLSFHRICDIVSDLSPCLTFKSLEFMAASLSPEIFDTLAKKLPRLQTLSIRFMRLQSIDTSLSLNRKEQVQTFAWLMAARRYTKWGLQRLRLTRIESTCDVPHPQSRTMRTVAQCFSSSIVLDCSYDCFCQKGLFGGEEED